MVLIDLAETTAVNELLADCNRLLEPIPQVATYWAGEPLDIGRGPAIDGTYTVGLCVGFDSVEDYRAYLLHPGHVELVDRWKSKWNSVRLYDVTSSP